MPVDEVLALAIGAGELQSDAVPALRALTRLETPTLDMVDAAVKRLHTAAQAAAGAATAMINLADQRTDLLRSALRFHDQAGDTDCPVCAQGRLDDEWVVAAQESIAPTEEQLAEYRSTAQELKAARSALITLVQDLPVAELTGVELEALPVYNDAVTAAQQLPVGDDALASRAESALSEVIAAAETLREQAADELARREGAWAPVAAQLAGWVRLEEHARDIDDELKATTAAKRWVGEHAAEFRNLRLKPIAGP